MHSPMHEKVRPLVNMSASAALEEMLKGRAASLSSPSSVLKKGGVGGLHERRPQPMLKPLLSSAALDEMLKKSTSISTPASVSALDHLLMKAPSSGAATSALGGVPKPPPTLKPLVATTTLDRKLKNSAPATSFSNPALAAMDQMTKSSLGAATSALGGGQTKAPPALKPLVSIPTLKPLVSTPALNGLIKKSAPTPASCSSSSTPALAALDQLMKSSPGAATSALGGPAEPLPALKPLVPSVAPKGVLKNCAPTSSFPSSSTPALTALDQLMKSSLGVVTSRSPASLALDGKIMDCSSSPATAALDESIRSRKRVKMCSDEEHIPRRASLMALPSTKTKFDTTDLFQAIEAPDSKNEFSFPSFTWDPNDDDDEEEQSPGGLLKNTNDEMSHPLVGSCSSFGKSLSASCLLGKRPRGGGRRGGLVRSKTLKSKVDQLVNQHHAPFPVLLQAAK